MMEDAWGDHGNSQANPAAIVTHPPRLRCYSKRMEIRRARSYHTAVRFDLTSVYMAMEMANECKSGMCDRGFRIPHNSFVVTLQQSGNPFSRTETRLARLRLYGKLHFFGYHTLVQ